MKECSHCHQEIAEPLTYRTAPLIIIPPPIKSPHLTKVIAKVLGRNLLTGGKYIGLFILAGGIAGGICEGLGWITAQIIPMTRVDGLIYFATGMLISLCLLDFFFIFYLFILLIR